MLETTLWLLIALASLGASLLLAGAYLRAWRYISRAERLPIGEPLRIPAWANLRRELLRVLTQSLFAGAGALAVAQRAGYGFEGAGMVILACLIGGNATIALNSWSDWRDDRRLIGAVETWDQHYIAVPKDRAPEGEGS